MTDLELELKNNSETLEHLRRSPLLVLFYAVNTKAHRKYREYAAKCSIEEKAEACAETLNAVQKGLLWRGVAILLGRLEDARVGIRQIGRHNVIDNSPLRPDDYYSVVVIVKNEARYMREFVLFYLATGADRIYVYDNDSTDDLLGALDPFLKDGRVVYRRWSGKVVQTAAYRDAVRRTKRKTKWLAIIDADEFLFSPKGSMPEQLRDYEDHPGVCANWILFGPNGHDRRPEGLVMDNYTSALADHDSQVNRFIKSIVQPSRVESIRHTHYAKYKKGCFAVDENKVPVDNRYAFAPNIGRAVTAHNNRNVFRINHYNTKSLEDLEEKCRRGCADRAPEKKMEALLAQFSVPMTEDYSIKPYADIVRKDY